MKKSLLLVALMLCIVVTGVIAGDKGQNKLQKKSGWDEAAGYVKPGGKGQEDSGFPRPFNELTQWSAPQTAAISTGYYFYDSDERGLDSNKLKDIWKPRKLFPPDTTYQPNLWKRILPGPRIVAKEFWDGNTDGKHFFRNPADMMTKDIFDPAATGLDTTANAIAGPMPLGIKGGFFFNGLRYDSFYVSVNGAIGLTNRRYIYGADGSKAIPTGSDNCYDINSMDWFVGGNMPAPPNLATRLRVNVDRVLYGDLDGDGKSDNDGMKDIIPDNFGYISAICGRDPKTFYETPVGDPVYTKTAGLRSDGGAGNLSMVTGNGYASADCKPAIISPFWGPLQMSQYNNEKKAKEDYGKVYFKRTITGDSLIIAFHNVTFEGTITNIPYGTLNFAKDARYNNMDYYMEWDAQVVLDRRDSSITFVFQRLAGTTLGGAWPGDNLRANTTCGVHGYARHINYDSKNPDIQVKKGSYDYPWAGEYAQYTHYFGKYSFQSYQYPFQGTVIKFKQWKNTLRVANIGYRVRNTDPATLDNPNYDFTVQVPADDYELLAGEPLIGAIQPRCLIQNLTNEIQGRNGVNFTIEDFEFWARFRIKNLITDRIVYNRSVPISANCMGLEGNWDSCYNGEPAIRVRLCNDVVADAKLKYKVNTIFSGPQFKANKFTGVPPYRFVQIDFPPFEPNEFSDHQIGRLRAYVIAEPLDLKTMEPIGDQWPFDDTTSVRLFVMRRLSNFQEDVTQYHIDIETRLQIPSVLKWVTIDGVVTHGEAISIHPLPPRGQWTRHMPGEATPNPNAAKVSSPVINLNRLMAAGSAEIDAHPNVKCMTEWGAATNLRGDEIRSYPIDLRGKIGAMFSISVARGNRVSVDFLQDYLRNFGDDEMKGPEGKTFYNGSPFNAERIPGNGASADILAVEFAKPSDDGVNDICNIALENWRHNPSRRGSKVAVIKTMPFLTIYGSGGYLRGFLESDPDSALDYPNDTKFQYNAMRPDFYDDGVDWEFKKYFIQIPDTFIQWKRDGAKNIRFRVRVYAKDHRISTMPPTEVDDADNFYIDNVNILFPEEITDVEMSSVRLQWPYTIVPPSQATGIPIICKIANSTSKAAPSIAVKVKVFKDGDFDAVKGKAKTGAKPIYCRTENVPNLQAGQEIEVTMPAWNVRRHQTTAKQAYTLVAYSIAPYQDMIKNNDTTFYPIEIDLGQYYAYEPVLTTPINNAGFGLNTPGNSNSRSIDDEDRMGPGLTTEPYAGKIASKFVVFNTDTITGFHALLGSWNASPEWMELAIYKGDDKTPSGEKVAGSYMLARRGEFNKRYYYNTYVPYFLDKPIELPSGTYWVAITQLGLDPLCLGGSASRTRMKIMNHYVSPENGAWGEKGYNLYIDKNLRIYQNNHWTNDNYFAYLNTLPKDEKGKWVPFTPLPGNIAYPVTDHVGTTLDWIQATPTYFNASWIPMIHPLFTSISSLISGTEKSSFEECPDDIIIPVELLGFKGTVKQAGIELIWETASETNNYGFEVQRRLNSNQEWQQVAFVTGAGNTVTNKYYSFLDKQVTAGETYSYRLRQIDNDGTVSCASSNILTITYDLIGNLELFQNTPNPFNNQTTLSYYLPNDTDIKLDVIDMYGKVVRVITDGTVKAGKTSVNWDGRDSEGTILPSGTYICRILAGNEVKTQKMTIVR